jgi:cytochrome P450
MDVEPSGAEIIGALMSEPGRTDPYPLYARARELGPLPCIQEGFYLTTSYAEANRVLRDPAFGQIDSDAPGISEAMTHASIAHFRNSILEMNPPRHTRVRRLMSAAFTPRRTAGLESAIAAVVDSLAEDLAALGADGSPVDFMEHFAFRLPVSVICELIGVPAEDRPRFRPLAHALSASLELMQDFSGLGPADAAAEEVAEYFTKLIELRRAEPRDDLVSALVQHTDGPDGLMTDEELLGNLLLLLVAGFETTTSLLGSGLKILFERPALRAGLADGRLPVAGFVEEVLRYESPVQLTSRTVVQPGVELAGKRMPPGAEVMLLLGAANRDPERFVDPDTFDPMRADNQPLSFGAGAHFCLGAALARLEAAVAFPRLLTRLPAIAPGAEPPTRRDRLVLRGYDTLPVTVA